jgi:hypothetical protein
VTNPLISSWCGVFCFARDQRRDAGQAGRAQSSESSDDSNGSDGGRKSPKPRRKDSHKAGKQPAKDSGEAARKRSTANDDPYLVIPARIYLDSAISAPMLRAMTALATQRPKEPLKFLGDFFLAEHEKAGEEGTEHIVE